LALQQTGLSLACGSLWRPQLNTGTLGGRESGRKFTGIFGTEGHLERLAYYQPEGLLSGRGPSGLRLSLQRPAGCP
jgi:hypothetical protein